jgi:RNA-binding protein
MAELSSGQRQYLRRMAHDARPLVQIGKHGMSEGLLASVDHALETHELVKVKFLGYGDEKRDLAQQLAERSGSTLVTLIGNIAILYRYQADPEKRQIELPA